MKSLESTKTGVAVSSLIQSHSVIIKLLVFHNKSLQEWLSFDDQLSSASNNFFYYISALYCLQSIKRFSLNRLGIFTNSPFGSSSWNSLYGETSSELTTQPLVISKQLDQYFRKCKSRGTNPQASVILNHYGNSFFQTLFDSEYSTYSFTNRIETRQIASLAKVCFGIVNHSQMAKNRAEHSIAVLNLFNYLCYILQLKVPGKVEQNFCLEELEIIHRTKPTREFLVPNRRTWNDFFRKNVKDLPNHFNTTLFDTYSTVENDDMMAIRLEIYLIMAEIYIYQSIWGEQLSPTSGWLADDGYSQDSEHYIASNVLRVMAINSLGGNFQKTINSFLKSTGLLKYLNLWTNTDKFFKTV
jgi:hypothetical protein